MADGVSIKEKVANAFQSNPELYEGILDYDGDHSLKAVDIEQKAGQFVLLPVGETFIGIPKEQVSAQTLRHLLCLKPDEADAEICPESDNPFIKSITGAGSSESGPTTISIEELEPADIAKMTPQEINDLLDQIENWKGIDGKKKVQYAADLLFGKASTPRKSIVKIVDKLDLPIIEQYKEDLKKDIVDKLANREAGSQFAQNLVLYLFKIKSIESDIENFQKAEDEDEKRKMAQTITKEARNFWFWGLFNRNLLPDLIAFTQPYVIATAIGRITALFPNKRDHEPFDLINLIKIDANGFVSLVDRSLSEDLHQNMSLLAGDIAEKIGIPQEEVELYLALITSPPRHGDRIETFLAKARDRGQSKSVEDRWRSLQELELATISDAYKYEQLQLNKELIKETAGQINYLEGHFDGEDKRIFDKHRAFLARLVILEGIISVVKIERDSGYGISEFEFRDAQNQMLDRLGDIYSKNHPAYRKFADRIKRYEFGILLRQISGSASVIDETFRSSVTDIAMAESLNLRFTRLDEGQKEIQAQLKEIEGKIDDMSEKVEDTYSSIKALEKKSKSSEALGSSTEEIITRKLAKAVFKRLISTKGEAAKKLGELLNGVQSQLSGIRDQAVEHLNESMRTALGNIMPSLPDEIKKEINQAIDECDQLHEQGKDANARLKFLVDELKPTIPQIEEADKALAQIIKDVLESSDNLVKEDALDALSGTSELAKILEQHLQVLEETNPELGKAFARTEGDLAIFTQAARTLNEIYSDMEGVIEDSKVYIETIGDFAGRVDGGVLELYSEWDSFSGKLVPIEQDIQKKLRGIAAKLEALGKDVGECNEDMKTTLDSMADIIAKIESDVVKKLSIAKVNEKIKEIKAGFDGLVDHLGDPRVELMVPVVGDGEIRSYAVFSFELYSNPYFHLGLTLPMGLNESELGIGLEGIFKVGDELETQFQAGAEARYVAPIDDKLGAGDIFYGQAEDQISLFAGVRFILGGLIPMFVRGGWTFSDTLLHQDVTHNVCLQLGLEI